MTLEILLALAASVFTASASLMLRAGVATLGVAAGVTWGFAAAVVKELRAHLGQGAGAVFSDWSPYVLGITVFAEHVRHDADDLVAEAALLVVLVASVVLLCRCPVVARDAPLEGGAGRGRGAY